MAGLMSPIDKTKLNNPVITSIQSTAIAKPIIAGYYIFMTTPSDGLPINVALNDIAHYDGANWTLYITYANANVTILVGSGSNYITYAKENGTWTSMSAGSSGGVSSVNGSTGPVTITKTTVGLSNVDNVQQVPLSTKGVANGVASLDASGKVPVTQVPNVNAQIVSVTNKAARLALATNNTNLMIALQADTNWMWAINMGQSPATEVNWIDCGSTAAAVVSVNGSTGAVTVSCATLGAVPTTTTVNGKALSSNINLSLTDLFTPDSDTTKFFRKDGIWAAPNANNSGHITMTTSSAITKGIAIMVDSSGLATQTGLDLSKCIGIAQSTVLSGASVSVALFGQSVSACHSGLTINAMYYIQSDGSLSTSSSAYCIGRAISSSQIDLNTAGASSGGGVAASYMRAVATTTQTISAANTIVVFASIDASAGSDITLASNCFLLKAGKTYKLRGSVGYITGSSGTGGFVQWRTGQTGGSGTLLGMPLLVETSNSASVTGSDSIYAEAIYTPTIDTYVHLETITSTITLLGASTALPAAMIEVIAGQAAVTGQSVDYVQCATTNITSTGILPIIKSSGNLNVSSNLITLLAGKTYYLSAMLSFRTATYAVWQWQNSSGTILSGVTQGNSAGFSSTDPLAPAPACGFYTPIIDTQVKIVITSITGASGLATDMTSVTVNQIGTSSVTNMVGATATLPGIGGTVSAPAAGDQTAYLRGDGIWDKKQWISFTPTITAITTNPTPGTGAYFKCHYMIDGKNLKIRFLFVGTSVAHNIGSGNYKINISSIPVTIDTAQLIVDGTGYADSQVGIGSITNNTITYNGMVKIDVLSTTELGAWVHQAWNGTGAANFWSSTNHAIVSKLSFQAEIPIV